MRNGQELTNSQRTKVAYLTWTDVDENLTSAINILLCHQYERRQAVNITKALKFAKEFGYDSNSTVLDAIFDLNDKELYQVMKLLEDDNLQFCLSCLTGATSTQMKQYRDILTSFSHKEDCEKFSSLYPFKKVSKIVPLDEGCKVLLKAYNQGELWLCDSIIDSKIVTSDAMCMLDILKKDKNISIEILKTLTCNRYAATHGLSVFNEKGTNAFYRFCELVKECNDKVSKIKKIDYKDHDYIMVNCTNMIDLAILGGYTTDDIVLMTNIFINNKINFNNAICDCAKIVHSNISFGENYKGSIIGAINTLDIRDNIISNISSMPMYRSVLIKDILDNAVANGASQDEYENNINNVFSSKNSGNRRYTSRQIETHIKAIRDRYPFYTRFNTYFNKLLDKSFDVDFDIKQEAIEKRKREAEEKKIEKEKKLAPIAKSVISKIVLGDYPTRQAFINEENITSGEFTKYLKLVEKYYPALYDQYKKRACRNSAIQLSIMESSLRPIIEHMKESYNKVKSGEKSSSKIYDIYDYYVVDRSKIDVFTANKMINSSTRFTKSEAKMFDSFVLKNHNKMYMISKNTIYEDTYIIINNNGVEVEIDDNMKSSIINFMTKNNIPMYGYLYRTIARNIVKGNLDITV